jgi:hypothetical protein
VDSDAAIRGEGVGKVGPTQGETIIVPVPPPLIANDTEALPATGGEVIFMPP